jgi:hypothetical protein
LDSLQSEEFAIALAHPEPWDLLRSLVFSWNLAGLTKEQIHQLFMERIRTAADREYDILADILDELCCTKPQRFWLLPNEPLAASTMAPQEFPLLQLTRAPTVTATQFDHVLTEFALPPSYRAFATRYGKGLLCGLLLVYIPLGDHCDSLATSSDELHHVIRESIDARLMEYEPEGSESLALRLVPFGVSENGHVLGWDPNVPTGAGEFAIYVIGSKHLAMYYGGANLYEFVARCCDERVRETLGPGYKPLPATFAPREVRP